MHLWRIHDTIPNTGRLLFVLRYLEMSQETSEETDAYPLELLPSSYTYHNICPCRQHFFVPDIFQLVCARIYQFLFSSHSLAGRVSALSMRWACPARVLDPPHPGQAQGPHIHPTPPLVPTRVGRQEQEPIRIDRG